MKYNFVYKTTNNINGDYYYGVHSTNKLDDGYMGSRAVRKLAQTQERHDKISSTVRKTWSNKELREQQSKILKGKNVQKKQEKNE